MQRVSRILIMLAALALFASACGGSSTPAAIDATAEAVEESVDGSDAADASPEELAKREPLDREPLDIVTNDDPSNDEADAAEGDDTSGDAAADSDDGGITLNAGVIEATNDRAPTDAASCVTTALDASPELRDAWTDILRDEAANLPEDSAAVMDPILDCVTFGAVVADVIEREDGVTLSDTSISCIDSAVTGREDLLISLIGDGATGDIDEDLLLAMVRCVSDEELTALMG